MSIIKTSRETTDFNEFATLIKNGAVENILLQPGPFHARITSTFTPNMIISRFKQSRGFFQKGFAAPGYLTFLIWEPGPLFTWHNNLLQRAEIVVVWGIEHLAVVGDGFQGYPISIREEYFIEQCKSRGLNSLAKSFALNTHFKIPDSQIQRLREKVNVISDSTEELNAEILEVEILKLLFDCFGSSTAKSVKDVYAELTQAVNYIMVNRNKSISIQEICEEFEISPRTLRYQFNRLYGISPSNFIKAIRLNNLYKALKENNRKEPIFVTANRLGFSHMGQLAKEFKGLFGLYPRDVRHKKNKIET